LRIAAKGLDKLLELEAHYKKKTGRYFDIDIIGSGPEQREIQRSFLGKQQQLQNQCNESVTSKADNSNSSKLQPKRHWRYFRQPIPARFLGRQDHAEIGPHYNIFVNPSITEVLCTTTAEAVAMSKWVIVPRHASNEFFLQFPNCLQYNNKNEFVELLQYAMANPVHYVMGTGSDPTTVGQELHVDRSEMYAPLSWEAATQRLIDTAYLSKREARRRDRLTLQKDDRSIQEWHYTLGNGKSGDVLRKVLGGGPVAEQSTYKREYSSISLTSSLG
jgi:digalactosyldiacylglycerol synthase